MKLELIQPWSVPVVKTTLSPQVLQTMVEISDQVLDGENLEIDLDILKQRGVKDFFIDAVCQFVIVCKYQMLPLMIEEITQEKYDKIVKSLKFLSFRQVKGNEAIVDKFCNNDTCEIELDDTIKKIEVETV